MRSHFGTKLGYFMILFLWLLRSRREWRKWEREGLETKGVGRVGHYFRPDLVQFKPFTYYQLTQKPFILWDD
ncbi:hypothetical protein KY290_020247 [Solanum tuberosum]|uniref:Uncharacterized protein n=1 Tax=Solanum tuberosum TaxID=4113 RepID=A0ABQ7UY81_SOLTU|nr:hypothetical protein KY289_019402 [Solanum tuberosum]KAH0756754.1 hypothetical protein KY290_020247 [Solanum tuberosum]